MHKMTKAQLLKKLQVSPVTGGNGVTEAALQAYIDNVCVQLQAQGCPDSAIKIDKENRRMEFGNQFLLLPRPFEFAGLLDVHSSYVRAGGLRIEIADIIVTDTGFRTKTCEFTFKGEVSNA